jgi:hypothetical protein
MKEFLDGSLLNSWDLEFLASQWSLLQMLSIWIARASSSQFCERLHILLKKQENLEFIRRRSCNPTLITKLFKENSTLRSRQPSLIFDADDTEIISKQNLKRSQLQRIR